MQRARDKNGEAELAKLTAELNVKSSAASTDADERSRLQMEVDAAKRRVEQFLKKEQDKHLGQTVIEIHEN